MLSKTVLLCFCRMEFYLRGNGDQALPFELQAFEVPLAAAVRLFESETNALEGKLLPSLERLTAKVSLHSGYTTKTNHNNLRAFQLILLARYLLGVPEP